MAMRLEPRKLGRMVSSGVRRYPHQLLLSIMGRGAGKGPEGAVVPPWWRWGDGGPSLGAVWLGHATTLVRLGGLWILTDPVFSERIGPRVAGRTLGLSRLTPAPVPLSALPPIDIVLISHAHFDHLDRPTLARLADPRTKVVTAWKTAGLIPPGFDKVIELGPGEVFEQEGVEIAAVPVEHWGARFALDRKRGCNAYALRAGNERVVFAGDTAETGAFDDLPGADLAVFGIGAYDPWEHAHATPEQVWAMARRLGATHLMGVHHSTFDLSEEPPDEPLRRLIKAAGELHDRIVGRAPGEA
ncbi:MAG: hypothetical protein EA423_07355, partial [Phycisphaerales bacterium]